ncbi:MAG: four helix bundle protein [Candidatus Abawacabacteria bacterium]|nr:four helix bundle protein [Candidatus Abawacabacteria bacterium]
MFTYEKFPVYQKAHNLYTEILGTITEAKVNYIVSDQLQRALLSIIANIAEGTGKFSKRDKQNFYRIARGSCHESAALVKVLSNFCIDNDLIQKWYEELVIIGKMLTGMIRTFA